MRPNLNHSKNNITRLLIDRQYCDRERFLRNRLQTAKPFIKRLELECELVGHEGCVNCLEWSSDGRILASGSDDCHVLLWDPFRHKKLKDMSTPHRGNIFSVKFIPLTDNSTIVTGAADSRIYGFDLNHYEPIFRCNCHQVRVKRLAVGNETPHLFWSASEDGHVLQFDLRESHNCDKNQKIVLIDLTNYSGRYAEVKCIAVNPRRPELLAIGSNDGYARLYDRRMIKLDTMRSTYIGQGATTGQFDFYESDSIPQEGCVTYFAPGHLQKPSCGASQRAATYIAFSPNGTELLVNIGSEQIYLYDIYSTKQPDYLELPPVSAVKSYCGDAKRPKLMVSDENQKIVLIDLTNYSGRYAEVKCIAVNPRRPELLAIGSNDGYARLYDRRMIKLDNMRSTYVGQGATTGQFDFYESDSIPQEGCVTYFAPGHLQKPSCGASQRAATYIAFSPNGQELLVNIGSEQIYLYDIYSTKQPDYLELPPVSAVKSYCGDAKRPKLMVSDEVDQMKQEGNALLDKDKFTEAINQYTLAIQESPKYPALYLNRATALMKRKWRGDLYEALKDCITALKLDPSYVKAQFRMARALLELEYVQEAKTCLDEIKSRFPDYVNNHGVLMLNKDIESAMEKKDTNGNGTNGNTTDPIEISENEKLWRSTARDYKERFVGHCNTKTDIKEANFFGGDGQYIVAGSDDGNLFIWERPTSIIAEILVGDKSILNCVQPHPYQCLLASSGIDHEIRLWSPQPVEGYEQKHKAMETVNIKKNQDRMLEDPFELGSFPGAIGINAGREPIGQLSFVQHPSKKYLHTGILFNDKSCERRHPVFVHPPFRSAPTQISTYFASCSFGHRPLVKARHFPIRLKTAQGILHFLNLFVSILILLCLDVVRCCLTIEL
uniref:CSON010588 protein n=1 Tax=Culicoides sonorensis TaxID=179676 RepID=A0A336M2H1_CULSO